MILGTEERYSNLGMGLLGHVLELAAEKSFDQLLQEMVCDPLHLERTTIQAKDKLHLATGYSRVPVAQKHIRTEAVGAFRRPWSHRRQDLAQFLSAQMKPGLLSSEMLDQLHTASRLSDGSAARTGLGWSIESSSRSAES